VALAFERKRVPLDQSIAAQKKATTVPPSITCDKAHAIVDDFRFKDIKAETCEGTILDFNAPRDGKPFAIQIVTANGEVSAIVDWGDPERTMLRLRWFAALSLAAFISGAGAEAAESVQISINKLSQKMTVTVNGVEKYVWLVSTGARGYSTPSGSYTPFRMEPDHYSKEWDDAPMPHSIFFTPAGHAIHGSPHTKRLGTRASHGCVRLAPNNAARLFALVQKAGMRNTRVIVKGGFVNQSSFAARQ
jgi:hypothetical protein